MFSEYSINGYWFILFITLVILIHLAQEIILHRKRLFKIKYRIHVNGTRGKSSVARLIAAGLRGGNITTVCKTTGTLARFIRPDGSEEPVYRIGRTNVIEQVKVVKKASHYQPEALVIECMAVQPLLQSLCELKLVRSTHGVLVNARADHLDVMGPTEKDVALALAGTMTVKGKFYTTEKVYLDIFQMAADDRGSEIIAISDDEINDITEAEIKQFKYAEYASNVALALKICEACGVKREEALKGMWQATPDPGALTIHTIEHNHTKITFANGFAANDPDSTSDLWQKVIDLHPETDCVVGLVNCRADRGDRSRQMAEVIDSWQQPKSFLVIGSGTDAFIKQVGKIDTPIKNGEGYSVEQVLDYLTQGEEQHILAIGVCNIADIGFALLKHFSAKEIS